MASVTNPALQAFVAQIRDHLVLAQVQIRRATGGFELRHCMDRDCPAAELRSLAMPELRALSQFAASGAFRPLKSAPDLQRGWIFRAGDDAELEAALSHLYPGAVADWYASRLPQPPITSYREFAARQTGMYRIAALLTDAQAARAARACCHPAFCLKRRWWTVDGLAADSAGEKSLIPCLEPCAILLEFARTTMRAEQEDKVPLNLSRSEAHSMMAAVHRALAHPAGDAPVADFTDPCNPRRLQLVLEKLAALPIKFTVKTED